MPLAHMQERQNIGVTLLAGGVMYFCEVRSDGCVHVILLVSLSVWVCVYAGCVANLG
jgi:hypothetical protein